jgi:predicted small secreted protein
MKRVSLFLFACFGLAACGSHAAGAGADVEPAEECVAYATELRACFARTGTPTRSADALAASVIAPRDEQTRLTMNAACAHDRLQLHSACK